MKFFLNDPWIYLSAAGVFLALAFFIILVKKISVSDSTAEDSGSSSIPVSTIPSPEPVKVVLSALKQQAPSVKQEVTGLTGVFKVQASGATSPAVTYLVALKQNIEHFEKEIQQLKGQIASFTQKNDQHFDVLVRKIGQLQEELQNKGQQIPEIKLAEPVEIKPVEDIRDKTIKLDVAPALSSKTLPSVEEPKPEPVVPQKEKQEDVLKPKGKGPVWPV